MLYAIGVVVVLLWAVTGAFAVRLQADVAHWKRVNQIHQDMHEGSMKRISDAEGRHQEIEAGLREQIQHMAEKLATLRVEKGAAPETDRFVENPKPKEPYSQQLTDFILGIQYESARQLVEEEIDTLRLQDHTDEQIYDIISKGID
jgi:hypothetical protein